MQCKDIADDVFVAAIVEAQRRRGSIWANRFEVAAVLAGRADTIVPFGPDWHRPADVEGEYPQRLILAKARKLIKRRLITGCACGCRGDFEPATTTS